MMRFPNETIIDSLRKKYPAGTRVELIQSGAWLDELNRETQNVRITADYPANLSAMILYTERYL